MTRKPRRLLLVLPLALGLVGIAPPGTPEPEVADAPPEQYLAPPQFPMSGYEPLRAGHPLRLIAYALHPVGVILDYAIFRPAYWIGSHEPIRTLVGRER
jgi:hypothetical protein